jgi:restriction system protein
MIPADAGTDMNNLEKLLRSALQFVTRPTWDEPFEASFEELESKKYDRFTLRAVRVLKRAGDAARQHNQELIELEHLTLGLFEEQQGVGYRVLREMLHVDELQLQPFLSPRIITQLAPSLRPRFSENSVGVIEAAVDEARRLNHGYLGTEHLLLGLLRQDSFEARQLREALGVSLERAKEAIIRMLTPGYVPNVATSLDFETASIIPPVVLDTIVIPGSRTTEGQLIEAVSIAWFEIIDAILKDPDFIHHLTWRQWEEMIAGAYKQQGFKVILTPGSGDGGRDVIAESRELGAIRFFDQVKAYKPGHLVEANDVRAMLGVLTKYGNVSKGVITTTSDFAPGIPVEFQEFIPFRIELKAQRDLIEWLGTIRAASRK